MKLSGNSMILLDHLGDSAKVRVILGHGSRNPQKTAQEIAEYTLKIVQQTDLGE